MILGEVISKQPTNQPFSPAKSVNFRWVKLKYDWPVICMGITLYNNSPLAIDFQKKRKRKI